MDRRKRRCEEDENAVSEAISYVLIFGLISLGTAIIYLQGAPALDTAERQQITENSERAIALVQERLDEMVRQNAPQREVAVDMQDMTVGVGGMEQGSVNVTVHEGTNVTSYTAPLSPVFIEVGDRTMAYENGAVLMGQRDVSQSWAIDDDPSWAFSTNDTGYVKSGFVRTISTTGNAEMSGQGRVRFIFDSVGQTNENFNEVDRLNITVESPRTGAWEDYFGRLNSSINASEVTADDDRVTFEIDGFDGGTGSLSYDEQRLQTRVE